MILHNPTAVVFSVFNIARLLAFIAVHLLAFGVVPLLAYVVDYREDEQFRHA